MLTIFKFGGGLVVYRLVLMRHYTMQTGIHTGGEDLGYPPQKYFPPPPNPFSIDIIWHNYNKIHVRLFFCLKKYFIEVHIAYAWSFNCYLHQVLQV